MAGFGIARSLVFVALIAMLRGTAPVGATVLQPTVDGIVRDGVSCGPRDGVPDCIIENGIVQVADVPQFEDRGIIGFELSALSAPVIGAELFLPVFGSSGPLPFTVDVFGYPQDGPLSLADWDSGVPVTSFPYSGEQLVTLDVTSFIRDLVSSGYTSARFNFRFAVPSDITSNGPFVAFGSLEYPPAASLAVNPEPGTRVLLGLGLAAAAGFGRKRLS